MAADKKLLENSLENETLVMVLINAKRSISEDKKFGNGVGPAFGPLGYVMRHTAVYLHESPSIRKLSNEIVSDGYSVLIDADFFRRLMKEEDVSNGTRSGVIPAVLMGVAACAARVCGVDPALQKHLGLLSFGDERPTASAIGVNVAVVTPGELDAALRTGDHITAAGILAETGARESDEFFERLLVQIDACRDFAENIPVPWAGVTEMIPRQTQDGFAPSKKVMVM